MGDPSKIVLLETLVDVIERQGLLRSVTTNGDYVVKGLKEIEVRIKS